MICLLAALTVIAAALLNRAAGSDLYGMKGRVSLPGKPVLYVAPVLGLLAWGWLPWQMAIALAVAFLIWRIPAWGRWFTMDRHPIGWNRTKGPSAFERCIEAVSFNYGRLAMFWRMLVTSPAIIPLAWLVSPTIGCVLAFMVCSAALLWLAYELGWRLNHDNGIPVAEYIAGAMWGALIVLIALYDPAAAAIPYTGGGF